MSLARHRRLLVVALLPLLGFLGFLAYRIVNRSATDPHRAKQQKWVADATAVWSSRTFASTRDIASIDRPVYRILWEQSQAKPELPLSDHQLTQAVKAFGLFLSAYSTKDFTEYLRFRAPVPNYSAVGERVDWTKNYYIKYLKASESDVAIAPVALLKKWWDDDTMGAQAYVIGLDIDSIRISLLSECGQLTPKDLDLLSPLPAAGFQGYYPYIKFDDQDAVASSKAGAITVTIGCIVKVRSPDKPAPMLYRAYWSEAHGQWLPLSVAIGSVFNRRCAPLF